MATEKISSLNKLGNSTSNLNGLEVEKAKNTISNLNGVETTKVKNTIQVKKATELNSMESTSKKADNASVKSVVSSSEKKVTTDTTNLTSKQIITWKNDVDSAITQKLVGSLKNAYDSAIKLNQVTASGQDENNLSYRFNDLAKVTNQASKQLTTFMNEFDTSLTSYIDTVKKAEETTAESVRQKIDQFAEASANIAKLKM